MPDESTDLSQSQYQTVRDYVAARKSGNNAACDRIEADVKARIKTPRIDDRELAEIARVGMTVPFNGIRVRITRRHRWTSF
jgi:hypothetical protein